MKKVIGAMILMWASLSFAVSQKSEWSEIFASPYTVSGEQIMMDGHILPITAFCNLSQTHIQTTKEVAVCTQWGNGTNGQCVKSVMMKLSVKRDFTEHFNDDRGHKFAQPGYYGNDYELGVYSHDSRDPKLLFTKMYTLPGC